MSAEGWPVSAVRFRVRDRAAQQSFYESVLGLETEHETADEVHLAPAGEAFRVELNEDESAVARPRPSIGLFHLAYRLPDRSSLAEAILHLRDEGIAIEGMADHGVSEAVYLADAEGNGIELYRDRDPEAWPRQGEMVAMATDPLDVGELLAHAEEPAPPPAGTEIGHIHLHVGELDEAHVFFAEGLGLQVRQRDYPGALFFARGDYHHHVGANTWAEGQRAPDAAAGLESYTWQGDMDKIEERLREQGREPTSVDGALVARDPAGVLLHVPEG